MLADIDARVPLKINKNNIRGWEKLPGTRINAVMATKSIRIVISNFVIFMKFVILLKFSHLK